MSNWFVKLQHWSNNLFKFLGKVREDFVGYTNVTGDTTGEHIAEAIITRLQALDLVPSNLGHSLMMEQVTALYPHKILCTSRHCIPYIQRFTKSECFCPYRQHDGQIKGSWSTN